ncbi:GDSL-type esterase/lipase family protein [Rhodoplanes sp. TEM]|uniref:GDSL-type esterase/lipase family protein n=1 Tax=Rhodoplanes tepidamans TaxID=200616 RepID=A0ABT5J6R6_RHOTP|nr:MULTISPECIES: GDSL-type esterase/lipase family protein [Rhodoplanes]MDC7785076.1 GDSL-type esterase/lipase family protein [Rhodoplanes tepidamans]MDC7982550.1 GDSL-type esterase/lipase family protein [Rhodoplanes sp. TEM]MDQ0356566.1 lysophospholipase L1-like esterase [Rhodoplanes tepidamans]
MHVVLLGDSVFDNAAYVADGGDVLSALRRLLPPGATATLLARDGATMDDLPDQLVRLPPDVTHVVVSIGGNDALRQFDLLDSPVRSVAEALDRLAGVRDRFLARYTAVADAIRATGRPAALCTIYEPRFPDPALRRTATAALTLLNDTITRAVFARALVLIDLRLVCARDEDFANPIEPSAAGGGRIAAAVARFAARPPAGPTVVT